MGSLSDVDTRVLVARVRAGDQQAWVVLSDRYTNLLWSVARSIGLSRADAADAVQTSWLGLVERLDSVREPEHLGSWLVLYRSARTAAGRRTRVWPRAPRGGPWPAQEASPRRCSAP
jgi:DNA-directed RNA polymerase specialized sigma24 family protein